MTNTHGRRQRLGLLGLLLSCTLWVCPSAFALNAELDVSQYAHTAWKTRDGFAKGRITSIAQTNDGYLWLGTEFGLYRFDGVRAVPWQPSGARQLPSNSIRGLLVARDGTLWIGTLKGLASWKDGKLTEYPEVAGQLIGALLQDREGTVWFATYLPGRLCAVKSGTVTCYGEGILGRSVDALYEDRKGNLWVGSETGLWRWTPGRAEQFKFASSMIRANSLIEDDSGALLVATSDGVKRLVSGKIQDYTLPGTAGNNGPHRFLRTQGGTLWVGSSQGLFHLHQGKTDRYSVVDGLSGDDVWSIFEDREGSVWVTTTNGLDRFREYASPRISREQGLSGEPFLVQAGADGAIWIGTANGLNRWENGHVTIYDRQITLDQNYIRDARERNFNGRVREIVDSGLTGMVRALGQDDQGRLWVGTSKGNFYFQEGRFHRASEVAPGNTWSIFGDGHGNMWINDGNAGLFHVVQGEAVQQTPLSRLGQKYIGARAAVPDPWQGGVWLGFYDGGISYFKDGEVRASYTSADGLGNGRVNQLRFGSRMPRALWAATEGGLSRIKDDHIETLSSKNGLPCDEIHWSVEDQDHAMWVYMPCGLARIERSEWHAWIDDPRHVVKTTLFDSSDGVISVGVYGSSGPHVTTTPDGKICFPHPEGVSVIDPRHLPLNKVPPPVHIEQVTADRKTYEVASNASADGSERLRLPPLIRDLEIDYTALSLVAAEKVRFRYKLEGWDRDWQDAGNRRQAFYTNLSPRNYRFRVLACNNSGVWNEAGTFMDFSVAPAYYQTIWFRLSCVAAFLLLLWSAYQLRLRQVAQQFNMRLEERVNERTRIARELHDTLLQSFHGLLLRFQAANNLLPERPEEARTTLEGAIDQAAQAITEGRDAVQGLRSSTMVTNDLALAISALGEEIGCGELNPNCAELDVEVEGTPRDLHPILRDEVYRIAGEAVRNAFKHAEAQQIEVEIRYDEQQLRLRIRDDGKGIDPKLRNEDGRSAHFGLRGMRERAKLLGGKLTVWSDVNSGTEVELGIPASRAYQASGARRRSWLAEKFSRHNTEMKS